MADCGFGFSTSEFSFQPPTFPPFLLLDQCLLPEKARSHHGKSLLCLTTLSK